jgi:peptidyl-prolyl cis-trans isomerase C
MRSRATIEKRRSPLPEIPMYSIHLSRLTGAAFAVGIALTLAVPASAKVLARVNGAEITDEDVKIALDDIGQSLPQQIEGPARQAYILDYLIDAKLVAQKAEAEKMGEGPEFAKKVAYYRDKVLMEDLLGKVAKDAASDTAIQKTYDDVAKQQKPEEEVRARHILVESEPDAQAALKRVNGGEDFAKVANEMSKDPGSKGGELGWFTKERMVPEFAEAAFKMQPGQISDPVKSQFGWHIIQVEERRQKQFPGLDQVRDQVTRYVVQKSQSELILKLREGAKVERTEPEKPADAAATPGPEAKTPANPSAPATSSK